MTKGKSKVEMGLFHAEKGLKSALKTDHKADAGVKANLGKAMSHLKAQMADCKKT